MHIANDYRYKILYFWANPQKYQTLVPTKNSHLKVVYYICTVFVYSIQKALNIQRLMILTGKDKKAMSL